MQKQKIAAATGIIAPILAFTCILVAIASYPKFSWSSNALSDLGVISGITGPVFNFGLYASGFLALIFALFGLFGYVGKGWVGKIGILLFATAAAALIAIGVFNESYGATHFVVSVWFFVMMPISLLVITCAFLLAKKGIMAIFTLLIGIAASLPWIMLLLFRYVTGVAIPEATSGLAVAAWVIVVSYTIIKQSKD